MAETVLCRTCHGTGQCQTCHGSGQVGGYYTLALGGSNTMAFRVRCNLCGESESLPYRGDHWICACGYRFTRRGTHATRSHKKVPELEQRMREG